MEPVKVIIEVSGGCVTAVLSSVDLDVCVVDYDSQEGASAADYDALVAQFEGEGNPRGTAEELACEVLTGRDSMFGRTFSDDLSLLDFANDPTTKNQL